MFFDQIKEIDGNIKALRDHMTTIGNSAEAHFDQLDDIAAHIIALEAIVCTALAKNVDKAAVLNWIKNETTESTGTGEGSEKARIVAEQLLSA